MAILDWIYPKKCLGCGAWGKYVCEQCVKKVERREASLRYEGIIRQAIKELKYRGIYDLVAELVEIWDPKISNLCAVRSDQLLVTAVPMWSGKQRKRGYNQAELIGWEVARRWGVEYMELLDRVRETKPMYGLSKHERRTNVKGAFGTSDQQAVNSEQKKNTKVVLIDDVWTSGATIQECARVLKQSGWKDVICMALAS